jgi:diguanylate cyclase (GGDEF)-like protein
MSKYLKLETVVVALFLISLALVALYEYCPKKVVVSGVGGEWFSQVETDIYRGGSSAGIDESTESELRYTYKLGDIDQHPYSVLIVSPQRSFKNKKLKQKIEKTGDKNLDWRDVRIEDQDLFNLDWLEKVRIVARVEGKEKETFRIHFRTRIDEAYDSSDEIPRSFTEGMFNLTDKNQEIVLSREQFKVPYWWLEQFKVNLAKHNQPSFSPLEWIEFLPGSRASNKQGTLVVESIEFEGHRYSRQAFYGFILCLWMGMAVGVIVKWMLKMAHEMRSLEAKAKRANIDFLTGLLNRHAVKDTSASFHSFEGNSEKSLSLVMFDIDHFKMLNDTYGHNYGDGVLKDVAAVVMDVTADESLTAIRWGGEEFLVISEDQDEPSASVLAHELRRRIEKETCVRCSFGVYELDGGESLVEGIGKADKALYASKWRGRNCVTRFSDCPDQLNRDMTQYSDGETKHAEVQTPRSDVPGLIAAGDALGGGCQNSPADIRI